MEHIPGIVAFLRDLVIIILGIVWIAAGAIVAVLAWMTWKVYKALPERAETVTRTAGELAGQVRQVLATSGDGARTGKEAIVFVSEKAVAPTIAAVSFAAGVRSFVKTLLEGPRHSGPVDGK